MILLIYEYFPVHFQIRFLLVNAFALSVEALLVLLLLVVDVFLERSVHFEGRVEAVFDRVVGSARHVFGYKRPLFAVLEEQVHQHFVLLQSPFLLHDVRIKMIVPPLAALFTDSSGELRGNEIPTLGTVLQNHAFEELILLYGPRTFGAALNLVLLLETEIL